MRKIVSLLLCVAISLSLSACGKNQEEKESADPEEVTLSAEEKSTLPQENTAASEETMEGCFDMTPPEFYLRMHEILGEYIRSGNSVDMELSVIETTPAVTISSEGNVLAVIALCNDRSQDPEEKVGSFNSVAALVYDQGFVKALCVTLMRVLDPELSPETAIDRCRSLVGDCSNKNSMEWGRYYYNFSPSEDCWMLSGGLMKKIS